MTLQKPKKPVTDPPVVRLRCREDGPLVVELPEAIDGAPSGTIQNTDHHREVFATFTNKSVLLLCRWGKSANHPFCNGSHKTCEFRARETAS